MSVKLRRSVQTGADEVIAEEFETSVEIFTVVLNKYFVPRDRIESFITDVRADGYQMLRSSEYCSGNAAGPCAAYPRGQHNCTHG